MFDTLTRLFALPRGRGSRLGARIQNARTQRHSGKAFGNPSAQHLSDIGVSSAATGKEAQRPSWDAPTNWTY